MLGQDDRKWLADQGFEFEVTNEAGVDNLVLKDYRLPEGFDHAQVDLLIRLPAGFPDTPPDMFWVDPQIKIKQTGALPQASEQIEPHVGRSWQRFSRHFAQGAWRPGIDSLESWVLCIRALLEKDVAP